MGDKNPSKRQEVRMKISSKAKERCSNPDFRLRMSEIGKQRIGEKNSFFGKKHSLESRKIIGNRTGPKGESHHWYKPNRNRKYPLVWRGTLKKAIRERDNYKCQECGIPQEECLRQLDVHHRDGNKLNCNPDNLVSLCNSCHSKIEHNKNHRPRINRVNSGNSRTENPEPSSLQCEKVQRLAEDGTPSLMTATSALHDESHDDIVRYSEESETLPAMAITQLHKMGG